MIEQFVKNFMEKKDALRAAFAAKHPDNYESIVRHVIEVVRDTDDEYNSPDPDRIHCIDDGNYQGTLVFVIACGGYQPDTYWYVKVGYGSCSGCDTLEAIRDYSGEPPTSSQIEDYLTLSLHVVQGMKRMGDE